MMLPTALKITAPVFVLVGCLHLVLGLNADLLLGANIGADVISDPVLDSQNRFYGVAFTVYGFLNPMADTQAKSWAKASGSVMPSSEP